MAKISARGATEVARIECYLGESRYIFVMCSDGRVLYRSTGDAGTGYTVHGRVRDTTKRTKEALSHIVYLNGYTVREW